MNINIPTVTDYFARQGPVILLESQSGEHPWSRISYLAARPKAEIRAYGNQIRISDEDGERSFQANPWEALQTFREVHNDWLFGYLGYDLKNHTEELSSRNPDAISVPDLYFMVPGFLLKKGRRSAEINILAGEIPLNPEAPAEESFEVQELQPQISKNTYLDSIGEAQRRIVEGDFYEINLSHQLRGAFDGSPRMLYEKMKSVGPVPFGAFLQIGDCTVCCQSPERFLRKEGSTVFSQPIKGTAGRGGTEQEDQTLKQALADSVKEQAENLMIVDLVRNDLSRIAEKGTVEVSRLFDIETFGTVHQMVSTIKAEAQEQDPVSILKVCFPMGSMTGAPKISAMRMIEQLENYRRGIYSGAIGYIKPNGDFDFNVVIRTAIIRDKELFYAVGGAITGDSDPVAEWKETLIKAQALMDAIDH